MKIILLKDIAKVGKKYEIKDISDGYALNMLIPKKLAIAATADAIKRVELERSRDEGEKKLHQDLLMKNLSELDGKTISLSERANDNGHLFAGINKIEIINSIQSQLRIQIDPEFILLDKPIKELGIHSIVAKALNKSIKFNLDIKGK